MTRPAAPQLERGVPARSLVRFYPSGRTATGWTFMLGEMGAAPDDDAPGTFMRFAAWVPGSQKQSGP